MIFLTVGTQFPFDRLVRALDNIVEDGLIDEEIFAQIGKSSYKPRNFTSVDSLDAVLYHKQVQKASNIIGHAGVGTIMMALENNKPLLVMPRLKKYGEVVNDHQVAIARRFEESGYLLTAYEVEELPVKVEKLKSFVPKKRQTQTQKMVERISKFLNDFIEKKTNMPR